VRGWVGYTLARTRRSFDDVNGGDPFAPKYDRRHDLKADPSTRNIPVILITIARRSRRE